VIAIPVKKFVIVGSCFRIRLADWSLFSIPIVVLLDLFHAQDAVLCSRPLPVGMSELQAVTVTVKMQLTVHCKDSSLDG